MKNKPKMLVTRIDPQVHGRFKGRCAEQGRTMQEILESLMLRYAEGKISTPRNHRKQ